ncbi:hypothetical protein BDV29DRAFT_176929 [Aspergillus leporis]|uniref:Uncharacterized protein n=1 Tax=Aspergillus leporis TaxID=41062 RepID=A0A5N5WZX9_9EURO|nr:hypothetical protein BDV29DRAFT_176929 [Aspergillus leporis]
MRLWFFYCFLILLECCFILYPFSPHCMYICYCSGIRALFESGLYECRLTIGIGS